MPQIGVTSRTWCRVLPFALAPFLTSCGDGTAPPEPAQLLFVTTTAGDDADADGYTYSIDGGSTRAIPSNGTVSAGQVPPGTRTIAFGGIAGNCTAAGTSPLVVTLTPGESREVKLDVTCEARLRLTATTTGEDLDVAFIAAVDAGPWRLLPPNTRLDLPGNAPGTHQLRLAGVAPNCTLTGPAQRQITIPADGIAAIQLDVACTARTQRILFGSTRDGGYNLYEMNADGSNTVRLTDGSRMALHGRWSPDAARIVYHSPTAFSGAEVTGFDVFVMNADGSGSTQLTTDGAGAVRNLFPDWSPDGTKILFEKDRQIWVMDANGANARKLRDLGYRPRWSPDGNRIAFTDIQAIWVMDADGSNAKIIQVAQNPDAHSAYPVWSPDGTKILFSSNRDELPEDIYVMSADGSGVVRLTFGGIAYEQFDWSPDGKRIAFRTTRDGGNPEIYVMNADGSGQTRIGPNPWDEFGPAWRP